MSATAHVLAAPLCVRCPVEGCEAGVDVPCRDLRTGEVLAEGHIMRWVAAVGGDPVELPPPGLVDELKALRPGRQR